MPDITRRELLQATGIAAIVVGISSLPYLLGYVSAAPGTEFGGFVIDLDDSHSHLAKMQQGMWDGWRYHILFTPEEHPGAYLNTFYIALGKLSGLLNLSLIKTYQLARLICGMALLITSYLFLSLFLKSRERRLVAYLLICFSSGLGWLVLLTGSATLWGLSPIDFWLMDAYTFFAILTFPHLTAAMTLLLLFFILALRYMENSHLWPLLASGMTLLGLVVIQPFAALLVDGILAVYWLLLFLRRRRLPSRETLAMTVWALAPLPLLAYYFTAFISDPVFQSWSAQNILPSPPLIHLLVGYGMVLLLAGTGAVHVMRRRDERPLLLVAWMTGALLLAYLPFTLQRRMLEGLHVPLCVLATMGMFEYLLPALTRMSWLQRLAAWRRYDTPGLRRLLLFSTIAVTLPSNLYLVAGSSLAAVQDDPSLYYSQEEMGAVDWLRNNTERSETVLASYPMGRLIPARAGNRVFMGHFIETVEVQRKKELATTFFRADTTDDFRRNLLNEYHIRYVLHGPREMLLGDFDPSRCQYLLPAYHNAEVTIYRVDT